jgi:hypothetical protein
MLTFAGEMEALLASLLVSVTVTPPAGAGLGSVTGNATDCPNATETFEGSPICPCVPVVTCWVADP